jgi:ADP-dependent NAD(P)H-hydrate dehydratase / NAD(P)H-hydrate epimerase
MQPAMLIVTTAMTNDPVLWLDCLPKLSGDAHKHDHGHALIVGGYPMTGAARLAARAAARTGAGLTTVAVPEIAFPIYATALTCIMVQPLADKCDLNRLLCEHSFSALLIGPGAGVAARTCADALALLATGKPALLDADALTSFSDNPDSLFSATAGNSILTPHEGEFARLFKVQGSRIERASFAARQSGAVIVLKGRETVIAAPDGRIIVNRNAPTTLATAGSGDVLGGIILGLLAQGMDPYFAAAAGVWMHGAAATAFGPGLIADDLPDLLPAVLRLLK